MYDPTPGRWTTEVPIGFAGGDANLYRYVGNDPTNETDPTGEQAFALGRLPEDAILKALGNNGYAIDLGTMKHPDGWNAHLFLILRGTGTAKATAGLNSEMDNSLGSFGNNRIFYYEAKYPTLLQDMKFDPAKLTKEQRLAIFKANLLRYGRAAKNEIGYEDFKGQGWKDAGLGAVYVQLELQYGNEGFRLLNFALSKGVRIESDNDSFWFTEKEYSNGKIQIAETKRRGLKRETTVEEAAKYLYTLLRDNKENIEEWANRNYNDPTSAAQMSDRMTDPHTGAPMPLHVGGRGGLARGFDDMLTEAAGQVRGLMWEYALAGLNVQSSAAARAAQKEREIGVMSTPAKKALQSEAKVGQKGQIDLASKGSTRFPRGDVPASPELYDFMRKEGIKIDQGWIARWKLWRAKANAQSGEIGKVLAKPDARRIELLEELVHDAQKKALHDANLPWWREYVNKFEPLLEVEAYDAMLAARRELDLTSAETTALRVRRQAWLDRLGSQHPEVWLEYMRNVGATRSPEQLWRDHQLRLQRGR